jgi:hypothetical protein
MFRKHRLALDHILLAMASVEDGDLDGAIDSLQDAMESPDYDETVEELDAANDDAFEDMESEDEEEYAEFEDDEYEEDEEDYSDDETLASVLASLEDEEDEFMEDPYGENLETSSIVRGSRSSSRRSSRPTVASTRATTRDTGRTRAQDNLRKLRRG